MQGEGWGRNMVKELKTVCNTTQGNISAGAGDLTKELLKSGCGVLGLS